MDFFNSYKVNLAIVVLFVFFFLYPRYSRGLNKFNGPFLASFSNWWRMWYAITGSQKEIYVDEHRKYGDIVRVGPNELSFGHPDAIRDIYGVNGLKQKSPIYGINSIPVNGKLFDVLFTCLDMKWHDVNKRLVNQAFTMSTLSNYEPWIDEVIRALSQQIQKKFVQTGDTMNLFEWFGFFSMDLATTITFGEPTGFIAAGEDINNGMLKKAQAFTVSQLFICKMPWLDPLLFKNRFILWLNKKGWYKPNMPFDPLVKRQFFERQKFWETTEGRKSDREMILDKLLRVQKEHPEYPDFEPMMHAMGIVGGASESIAIQTCSIFYYVLRNLPCLYKLQAEVDALDSDPSSPVSLSTASKLPYLQAVINEAFRMCYINRIPTPRMTPPSGATICGTFVPGNVEVNVYGSVVHHNKAIFGDDADIYRPERWLGPEEKVRPMKNALFNFGRGRYECIGKNLAVMELTKLVPSLIRQFEFRLVQPDQDWKLSNGGFREPTGLEAKVSARVL